MSELGSPAEIVAVVLAIAYLLLAVRENIACWYAAAVSTGIFLYVFWQVQLYMEAGLQVFYLAMAAYGWWSWRSGGANHGALTISTWHWRWHVLAIAAILIATLVSGTLLAGTDQRLPFVDSFTTWGAVVTTYMVTRKILENWIYWFVIDAVAMWLYIDRELYLTAGLFAVYLVIVVFGWLKWRREYLALRDANEQGA